MTVNANPYAIPEFQIGDEAPLVVPPVGPLGEALSEHVRLSHRLDLILERPDGTTATRVAEAILEPAVPPATSGTWAARYQLSATDLDQAGLWKAQLRILSPFGTRYTRQLLLRVLYNAGGQWVPPRAPLAIVAGSAVELALDLPAPTVDVP